MEEVWKPSIEQYEISNFGNLRKAGIYKVFGTEHSWHFLHQLVNGIR